jgi:hypothetical protein
MRPISLFALVAILLTIDPSVAQTPTLYDVDYRPVSARYLSFSTPHFDIIFEAGLESEARELAWRLEEHVGDVGAMVGHGGGLRMPVVLNGYDDRPNGFVTVRPFKQEIDAIAIKGPEITSRYESWIEAVGPHELVHAMHADVRSGFGLGMFIRPLAPDFARALNLGGPAGVNEGIAVLYESSIRAGAGRLHHPHFTMKYRAAVAGNHWSLARMLERTSFSRPFDRHYVGGAFYAAHLDDRDDLESFRRARRFFYQWPFLGYGAAMWYGNRAFPATFGHELRHAHRQTELERQYQEGPFDDPEVLFSEVGTAVVRPHALRDGSIVFHGRGYHRRPGFYRMDNGGNASLLAYAALAGDDHFVVEDDGTISFARLFHDVLPTGAATADLVTLGPDRRRHRRVTTDARIHAPARLPDESYVALQNSGQFSRVVRIDTEGSVTALAEPPRVLFRTVDVSPDGRVLAMVANVDGVEGVVRGEFDAEGNLLVQPWLFMTDIPVFDARFAPDGEMLILTAGSDVSNIYAFDVEHERLLQLTHVPYGALGGTVSADGQHVVFVNYGHERYDLARLPLRMDREVAINPQTVEFGGAPPAWERMTIGVRPYRAATRLGPRMLAPFVIADDDVVNQDGVSLGVGFGLSAEGVDPLNRWSYAVQPFYQKRELWGNASLASGRLPFFPTLRLFREPSTVTALFGDGTTGLVGREQRGIGLSATLPLILHSNVFTTRAGFFLAADVLQERLFDDDRATLDPFRTTATLRPGGFIAYRVQSNIRDLIPNTGTVVSVTSRYDVWHEVDRPTHSVTARLFQYLPLVQRAGTGLRVDAGVMVQNEWARMSSVFFAPRGYRSVFLGEGTFARAGLELVQPLAFVDDGLIILPIYVGATYLYGTAEMLEAVAGPRDLSLRSITGGFGLRIRFAHTTDLDLRFGLTIRDDASVRFSGR